jgi:hypothetical protein
MVESPSADGPPNGQREITVEAKWSFGRRRAPRNIGIGVAAAMICLGAASGAAAVRGAEPVAAAVPRAVDATVLNQWNVVAQAETLLTRPSSHGQARAIAMVQGAVYDAVNAIDRGHQPYLVDVAALDIAGDASYGAAIATAAHHVLVGIVAAPRVAALDTTYAATLAAIADGPAEDEGVRAGAAAAAAMLAARVGDGYMAPFDFSTHVGTGPGEWNPTALDPDPWVGQLAPFLINSADQFRSEGPNDLTSAAYAEEYDEVKRLGAINSTARTADQTTAAIFWQFPPAALWNRLTRDLSGTHGLDAVAEARLLAMVNLSAADAAISCWNDKYYWDFWRPVTAIRAGDTDGNPLTVGDSTWTPLFDAATPVTGAALGNPPFPDHPSGHTCLTGAVLNTMRGFFGTDKVAFDMHSGRFPGAPRHFGRFSDAMKEVIDARVWAGVHFRTADVQGSVIGKKVAQLVERDYFQPLG